MKYFLIFLMLFFCFQSFAQTTDQIRAQMAKIRQTTNWNDPAAAAKANEQIRELAKKLIAVNIDTGGTGSTQQQKNDENSKDTQKLNELSREMIDQKIDIWSQIWKSAVGGKGADILLAEPLRDKIVQEFKDDESPSATNADYFSEKDLLVIDMSLPTAQQLINQMECYKSIKTLVVTGGKNGAIVNLNDILTKASAYPLKELYIINFKHFVNTIPEKVGLFGKLNLLALFNNNIEKLPPGVGNLTSLKVLYVDMNPLITLEPVITSLKQLDTIGVAKTKISDEELERIRQSLTKCKILEQ